MSKTTSIEVVTNVLEWCMDKLATPGYVFTREDLAGRFTEDAQMITNGQLKCAGLDAHLLHFQEVQKKTNMIRIRFPLEVSISNENESAAYYKIDYVMKDGTAGVVHDSALWKTRDGKIALMVECAAFDGPEIPLENHK